MGDIGNLVGQVFGGGKSSYQEDQAKIWKDKYSSLYGDTQIDKVLDGKADNAAVGLPQGITDADYIASHQKWNVARANWDSLSENDRLAATDDQKTAKLAYDKRQSEQQSLQQVSRIFDQREAASKSIGSRGGNGGNGATGSGTVLTNGPPIFGTPTTGAKTLLGQ